MSHHLLRSRFFPFLSFVISLTTYLLNTFISWFALFSQYSIMCKCAPSNRAAWQHWKVCCNWCVKLIEGKELHNYFALYRIEYYSRELIKATCHSFEPHSCNKYIWSKHTLAISTCAFFSQVEELFLFWSFVFVAIS